MKRSVRGAIAAVMGGLLAAGMSPACVEYPQGIVVTKVVVPKASTGDDFCVVNAEDLSLVSGIIDVAVANSYAASLVVKNQLTTAADPGRNRVETAAVYLLGASIRQTVDGENLNAKAEDGRGGNEYRTPGSGFVPPATSSTISVDLLDVAAVKELQRRLAAQNKGVAASLTVLTFARVQAQSLGGLSLESQEFQFPIQVCYGCLVNFTPGPGTVCEAPPKSATGTTSTGPKNCRAGQDTAIDCYDPRCTTDFCKTKK